jgi:hypothetical protein
LNGVTDHICPVILTQTKNLPNSADVAGLNQKPIRIGHGLFQKELILNPLHSTFTSHVISLYVVNECQILKL